MMSTLVRIVPLRWWEIRDVAIALVHMCWAIRGESCPECVAAVKDALAARRRG
jgi:hypothetical protein